MSVCALAATCDFNTRHFRAQLAQGAFEYVVAVDGGLAHLDAAGCKPNYVLGDFDSLGYVPEGDNVEKHPAHKDKSDLELALDFASEKGFDELVIYGALGGRLDHTVGALQMCSRFAERGMGITLVGLDSAVRIVVGPGRFDIPFCEKGTVSVFSAVDESTGVSEWGMEYPLEDASLPNRTTLGLSNELMGVPAGVSVRRGTLYVFYPIA